MSLSSLTWTTFEVVGTSSPNAGKSLRIQMSATGLAVDGVPLTGGYQNLYILYPDPDTSLPNATIINLESDGTLDNTPVDIRYGVYPAGSVKIAYSSDGAAPESNVIELPALPLAGGGGGGGGGNNGGSGYNNMAALEYNYPSWEANVTQTNTITVLGEDSAALTVDETITVYVPLAKLKECVLYESNWELLEGEAAGSQPLPKVQFYPSGADFAKTELDQMFAKLKAKMADKPLAERTWDDDASATHDSFGKRLISNVTFTGSVFDSQDLPKVAIRSIVEGDITVDELTATVGRVDTDMSSHKAYLEGLFEQLVAADRIKKNDAAAVSTSFPAGWAGAKAPSLQVGDTLSFKVKYNFSKTREYEVDGDETSGQTKKALTLTIGGSTFTIQAGPDGSESSDPYSRTYEIKLVATAQ